MTSQEWDASFQAGDPAALGERVRHALRQAYEEHNATARAEDRVDFGELSWNDSDSVIKVCRRAGQILRDQNPVPPDQPEHTE